MELVWGDHFKLCNLSRSHSAPLEHLKWHRKPPAQHSLTGKKSRRLDRKGEEGHREHKRTEKKISFEAVYILLQHSTLRLKLISSAFLSSCYAISFENNLKTTAGATIEAITPLSTVSRE